MMRSLNGSPFFRGGVTSMRSRFSTSHHPPRARTTTHCSPRWSCLGWWGGVRVVWGDEGDPRCRPEMMTEQHPLRAANAMKEGAAARLIQSAPNVCCVFVVLSIVVRVMALCPRLLCHSTHYVPYLTHLAGVVSWGMGLPGLSTSASPNQYRFGVAHTHSLTLFTSLDKRPLTSSSAATSCVCAVWW
jgi:hypothetical protein